MRELTIREKETNLLFEALDLVNELDENIGIETNSFVEDFEMLREKITDVMDYISGFKPLSVDK